MKKSKLSKYIILGAIAAVVATFILPKKEIRKGHPRDYAEIAADRLTSRWRNFSAYQPLRRR